MVAFVNCSSTAKKKFPKKVEPPKSRVSGPFSPTRLGFRPPCCPLRAHQPNMEPHISQDHIPGPVFLICKKPPPQLGKAWLGWGKGPFGWSKGKLSSFGCNSCRVRFQLFQRQDWAKAGAGQVSHRARPLSATAPFGNGRVASKAWSVSIRYLSSVGSIKPQVSIHPPNRETKHSTERVSERERERQGMGKSAMHTA